MYGVVNEGGTGRIAALPGHQGMRKDRHGASSRPTSCSRARSLASTMANNAWFVGFAPMEAPEIAVVALFENGEESYNAVPDRSRCFESLLRQESSSVEIANSIRATSAAYSHSAPRYPQAPSPRSALPHRKACSSNGVISFDPRIGLASADRHARSVHAWRAADLQRDAGHEMGRRLVEADHLGRHGLGDDVGDGDASIITRCSGRVIYLYIAAIALLIATLILGNKVFGSTRWIRVGGFTLQTSEFVKIVLILLVAKYLTDWKIDDARLERDRETRRLCRRPHAAGDERAGSGYFPDLHSDPDLWRSDGRVALEVPADYHWRCSWSPYRLDIIFLSRIRRIGWLVSSIRIAIRRERAFR